MKLFKRHFKCPSINASNNFVIVDNYIYKDAKQIFTGARGDNCCCNSIGGDEHYAIVVYESSFLFESPTEKKLAEIMLVDLQRMQTVVTLQLPNVSWVSDCRVSDGTIVSLVDNSGNLLHINLKSAVQSNLGKLVEGTSPYMYCFPSDNHIAIQTDTSIHLMSSDKKRLSEIPKAHEGLFEWAAGSTYSAYATSEPELHPELHILDFRNKNLVVTHKLPANVTSIAVHKNLILAGLKSGQIFFKDMSKGSKSDLIQLHSYSRVAVDKISVTDNQIFALYGNAIIAYDIPA